MRLLNLAEPAATLGTVRRLTEGRMAGLCQWDVFPEYSRTGWPECQGSSDKAQSMTDAKTGRASEG